MVWITGGWFHHAALLRDGTVWTWGENSAGNCGVAAPGVISEPTKVAEDAVMVWTDLTVDGALQISQQDMEMVWCGRLKYDPGYESIAEYGHFYPRPLNNTVIRKIDGSYWVCGENVGTEERVVTGEEADKTVVCTHEFHRCG